ncbi:hypothetical protein BSKO_10377 [Bryopsis sp. KO-2023]|nr:hypothetical protein BSKO_10377 [Bryopsis sp. KO-2023]
MTDRQDRLKRAKSPGGLQTTPGRHPRRNKSVAFDLPEEESPLPGVERLTPQNKSSLGGEFGADSFNFGFKPGQEETLDLTFNSSERPNFGQRGRRQTDEMDVDQESTGRRSTTFDKDQAMLFEPRESCAERSELMPPPSRKSNLGFLPDSPRREARKQSNFVSSPSVGHAKPDEHSDVVMGDFYSQIQGEGLMDTEEIGGEDLGSIDRQKMQKRSMKPLMETVPEEERVPMKRERSDSLNLTEELFGPRKSVTRATEFQGQRVSMVPTTALFTAAPAPVSGRPSFSLTAELAVPGASHPLDGYPTVKEFFAGILVENRDVDKWFEAPASIPPPISATEDPRYGSKAELLVRMIKSRIKQEKYEMGMKWVLERKQAVKTAFKKWEKETDADPESSTLFPLLKKFKESRGDKEKEILLEMEVESQVKLCEKAAKEEWDEQLLRLEEWHSEALGKAVQDLESFNERICEKIEAAKKEEEECKVVQVKMKELADLKTLLTSKKKQRSEKKMKAWEKEVKYLEMQKEILETRALRKEAKETPTEKDLIDITNELSMLLALQPFALEDFATNSAGNLNATVSVRKLFQVTMENLPKKSGAHGEQDYATITIEAPRKADAYRPKLHAAMCALSKLPENGECFKEIVKIPHPMVQYFLQKKLKILKTAVDFVKEIDALYISPVSYLGWELMAKNRFVFRFGNAKAGCLGKLLVEISPEVYPYEESLEFDFQVEFKRKGVEIPEEKILKEIREVRHGLNYMSRVVEKMTNLIKQVKR